ncbi:MAG: hypothetical protein AAFS08_13065 [Pseudomonadota bacterium]
MIFGTDGPSQDEVTANELLSGLEISCPPAPISLLLRQVLTSWISSQGWTLREAEVDELVVRLSVSFINEGWCFDDWSSGAVRVFPASSIALVAQLAVNAPFGETFKAEV